jgi:hypothetical protein
LANRDIVQARHLLSSIARGEQGNDLAGTSLHLLTGLPTSDPTNSFKAYRRDFTEKTPIESTAGFCLGRELTVKAHFSSQIIAEVPSTRTDRVAGESRFKLAKWLPHYLHWYVGAFRQRCRPGAWR